MQNGKIPTLIRRGNEEKAKRDIRDQDKGKGRKGKGSFPVLRREGTGQKAKFPH